MTILPEEASPAPATPPSPTPGSHPTRLGRFEITRYLGEGSFGRVYEALDPLLKRTVALKVAKPEQLQGPRRIERFQREARAAANLLHPHIVAVFDSGSEGGFHYIASAFVAGRSLAFVLEELPKGETLEVREAVEMVRKLADALGYAHKQGVVHRDVKPGNVMLRDDGEPLLMDFGLAARTDETEKLTIAGQFMGTPEYTAPEQWRGEAQAASDQYSLGCLFFELLTREQPFAGASSEHYLMLHTQQQAPSPRRYWPDLPRDLETICLKCLEKEPARRYADCQALADDLRRWLEGDPVSARRPGLVERLARWTRRNPLVAGLLTVIVLLTVSALVVITTLYGQAKNDRDDAREQTKTAQKERNEKQAEQERAEQELTRAERLLYASQIQAAQREWEAGNVGLAWKHLDSARWDFRNVEYRYLFTLFSHNHFTFRGHTTGVTSVALSSDGTRIVSGSADKTVKLWDSRTGKDLLTCKGHTGEVSSVALSSDGTRIVSGSSDKTAKVWDARTGKEVLTLKGHTEAVSSVAISKDGTRIVSGSYDNTVKVWDARSGKGLLTLDGFLLGDSVAISSDGTRIVSGRMDGTVQVHDALSGRILLTCKGHSLLVRSVALSGDGKWIVSGSADKTVKVQDALSGKVLLTCKGHTGEVNSVAISSDGTRIVSSSYDKTVKMWDARSGKDLLSLKGHAGPVFSVALSSDGRRIVSGGWDATVKVWDAHTGSDPLSLMGHTEAVRSVAISRDGTRIVSGGDDKTAKVQDARTGKEVLTLKGHTEAVSSIAISRDGTRIVCGSHDGTVQVHDALSGRVLLTCKGHSLPVYSVALSGDGKWIVSGSADKTVKVQDALSGKVLLTCKGHTGNVNSVAISNDATRIVSASGEGTVKVWDSRTGKDLLTLKGHIACVSSVALSSDGTRIVSGCWDGTVKVWDALSGKGLLTCKGHAATVTSVAINRDGTRIVTGSHDKTVKVWDALSGKELLTLKGHAATVTSVVINSDGTRIVSGSEDKTVKMWDARFGKDLLALTGHDVDVIGVAISREGGRILGQDETGKILAWSSVTGQLLADPPATMPPGGRQASTPDGKLRVRLEDWMVRVYRADLEQDRLQREARGRAFLERLARFDPDRHRQQADEALTAGDDFAAAFHLDLLACAQPSDNALAVYAAQARVRLGRQGDRAGTQPALADLAKRLHKEKNPQTAATLLFQALAGPWQKAEAATLLALARRQLAHQRTADTLRDFGAALYRVGRYAEAATTLAESVKAHGKGGAAATWLFQAMTARQQGKEDEADQLLARFEQWYGQQPFATWQERLPWTALLGEARKLIRTPPSMPKIAAGD